MFHRTMYPFINTNSLMIGLISLIFYHIPYIVLGDNTLYNIGDNLDVAIIFHKILNNSNHFFSFSNKIFIDAFHGGSVPRNALPSSLNFSSWIFFIFQPSVAYPLLRFIFSLIGFLGMYYFLKDHILKSGDYKIFSILISLSFAILPHKPVYGGAVFAIAPSLFFAFFNLVKLKRKKLSIFLCFILPFFSSAVMSTGFIWFTLAIFWIYYSFKDKSFQTFPLLGLMALFLGMFLDDIHLVLINFMDNTFISHRVNRLAGSWNIIEIISNAWHVFLTEKKAPLSTIHHSILFWFFGIICIGLAKGMEYIAKPLLCISGIFLNCILAFILKWNGFDILKNNFIFLSTFDFSRILNLNAFYWWVLLAVIINEILKSSRIKKNYIILLVIILGMSGPLYIIRNSWGYRENFARFIYNIKSHDYSSNMMVINQYYATPLFNEIRKWIDKDQETYRVGSIGLHPAVPAFNGFYTVDGYSNYYSLDHKLNFRDVIKSELDKFPSQLYKFDYWGNRCYLFSSELLPIWNHKDYIIPKNSNIEINKLEFNFNKLKEMGCDYLFSTVKINTDNNPHLVFHRKFENFEFPYSIFLYSIN